MLSIHLCNNVPLQYIRRVILNQPMQIYISKVIVIKRKSSLPRHRRRAPHAQFQLLLNILQALLVAHLVARLRESMPPDPHKVCRNRDWNCHGEEDP